MYIIDHTGVVSRQDKIEWSKCSSSEIDQSRSYRVSGDTEIPG